MRIFETRNAAMKELFSKFFSADAAMQSSREGLPYWLFWLLLSAILLLVVFIFLRDKELRRKMDHFFFHTKKKLIRMRHQRRLAKEHRKQGQLIKDLGQKAWEERIDVGEGKKVFDNLIDLEDSQKNLESEFIAVESKLKSLYTNLDEKTNKLDESLTEKEKEMNPSVEKLLGIKEREKEIGNLVIQKQAELETVVKGLNSVNNELNKTKDKITSHGEVNRIKTEKNNLKKDDYTKKKEDIDQEIKSLVDEKEILEKQKKQHQKTIDDFEKEILKIESEKKHQTKEFQKEIKEWEKNKSKITEKIEKIKQDKEPLFGDYGILVEKGRVDHHALEIFYSQIDRSNTRIEEIEKQIKALD